MGINQGLDQRVARESIGPMKSGTGGFTDGVQSMQICSAEHIGCDAAAHVMGGGNNRKRLLCHIKTKVETFFI